MSDTSKHRRSSSQSSIRLRTAVDCLAAGAQSGCVQITTSSSMRYVNLTDSSREAPLRRTGDAHLASFTHVPDRRTRTLIRPASPANASCLWAVAAPGTNPGPVRLGRRPHRLLPESGPYAVLGEERGDCRPVSIGESAGVTSGDAEAGVLLVYLFIGAFRNIAKEIGPCLLSLDELDSEMVSGFWEEATRVRTSHQAASTRLYHAARRSAWEAVSKARHRACTTLELDAATAVAGSSSSNPSQVLERAVRQGVISPIQCELIAATRVEGAPATRVAPSLGLTRAAASMQLTRGERRLAAWLTAPGLNPPAQHRQS